MIKLLNINNRKVLFNFILDWTDDDKLTHEEWKISRLVPFPKKGDSHDPNNWSDTNLLDGCSKFVRIILSRIEHKLIRNNRHPMKHGDTQRVRRDEAKFLLKTTLQS